MQRAQTLQMVQASYPHKQRPGRMAGALFLRNVLPCCSRRGILTPGNTSHSGKIPLQSGKSLPTVDNLYALSALLGVRMDEILVAAKPELKIAEIEPQAEACGGHAFAVGAYPLM